MKDLQYFTALSKKMSFILRHQPERFKVALDQNGWATMDSVLAGINKTHPKPTIEDILFVVKTDNKGRYQVSPDGKQIRAVQGHSTKQVKMELAPAVPPTYLYHGTAVQNLPSIKRDGLNKQRRHHVHLSLSRETAEIVGARHGKPVVLTIFAGRMHTDGYKFYLAENKVWLTDAVPPTYLMVTT